ncbi:hypothetical protein ACP4OV_006403 [Aristida adscensionis]
MLIPAPAPAPPPPLSSLHSLSSHYFLLPSLHFLPPGGARPLRRGDLAIRMGGGPRTYPGGVSKWQWKRMQARKARQLLKARLARERQLYEMRKRAELRDAVAHLERPWDPDSAAAVAPNLLSVAADDQLRALADRFHRPGGVDLWNDRDGPRVFASPATGAASARFFPRNAVHSVQPYALLGAGGEDGAPGAGGNAADLLLGRGGRAQGVCENAAEEETYGTGDCKPAVELMGKDGTWEPVNALDDSDVDNADDSSSDDDDDSVVTSESEGMGDAVSWHEQRATVRRNGRNNGAARWRAGSAMAAVSDDDRSWSGEGARQGNLLEQRWQGRSSIGSRRKPPGRNQRGLSTVQMKNRMGGGSFSDSEVIRASPEQKQRMRNRDGTMNGAWRSNAPRKDWSGEDFDSYSDNARGSNSGQQWGAQNKLKRSENGRGRPKPRYNASSNGRDKPRRYTRGNNGDGHTSANNGTGRSEFSSGFAEDMEAPTWKPRRINRARNNSSSRDDNMGRRSRRGDNGAAVRSQANPKESHWENGSEDGRRRASRNGGQRFRRDDYSLRPTSDLHSSWRETTSEELY